MPIIFKGWQAKIYISNLEIGTVKSINVTYDSPVEPYYGIEDPNMIPVTSVDQLGLVTISGTIEKAWVNTYYLKLLFGGDTPTIPNAEFDLRIVASQDADAPVLYLYNCRFKKGTLSIPANGWLEESYDFIVVSASTGLVPSHCPSGEQILNGTFDTDLSNWDDVNCTWTNYYGSGMCRFNSGGASIDQTLTTPVPVECVDIFTMDILHLGCGGPGTTVTITYTDYSTTIISGIGSGTLNLKPYLVVGKTIKEIKVYNLHYAEYEYVDNITLIGSG